MTDSDAGIAASPLARRIAARAAGVWDSSHRAQSTMSIKNPCDGPRCGLQSKTNAFGRSKSTGGMRCGAPGSGPSKKHDDASVACFERFGPEGALRLEAGFDIDRDLAKLLLLS